MVKQRSSGEQWKKEEFLSIRSVLSASSSSPSSSSYYYEQSDQEEELANEEEEEEAFPVTTALGWQQPGIDVADLDSLERW